MAIEVIERDDVSWPSWGIQKFLKLVGTKAILGAPSPKVGTTLDDIPGSPVLHSPRFGMKGCTVLHRLVDGFNVYDVLPGPGAKKDSSEKKRILFLPGGGFMNAALPFHFTMGAELVTYVPNTIFTLVSYPLAPHNTAPSVFAKIQKVMQTLLAESKSKGEKSIYLGDSAGSNLVLTTSLTEDPEALYPAAVMVISPAVDFHHANPGSITIEPYDCILTNEFCHTVSKLWANGWSFDDPRVSPIKADLKPFVERGIQIHGVVGKYDVLAPDGLEFLKKCQGAGINGKWLVWDKQVHDFPLWSVLGVYEGRESMKWIVDTLKAT